MSRSGRVGLHRQTGKHRPVAGVVTRLALPINLNGLFVVNLEEFIKSQIKSMAELRTLLFFHTFPQTDWDVMEVAQKLFLQPPVVVAVVTELVRKGFVISVGA